MTNVIYKGQEVDAEGAAALMDDDLREELHAKGFDGEQAFFDAYCAAHYERFGEEFVVN
jgi:hypothetical protein